MLLNDIESEWRGLAEMVFRGTNPSATQRSEMRKAFFAGYWALFCALEEIGQPHVSQTEGEMFLELRRRECEQFKKQLIDEYSEKN